MTNLTGPEWGPADGGRPRQLLVICHGVGAAGADVIWLAPLLAPLLPAALIVAPDGPEPCDFSTVGRQWFAIGTLNPATMGPGARRGAFALDGYIDAKLAAHGLPADAYALAGFSQGAMTVLFCGLRRAVPPRAILAYSGALVAADTLAAEIRNRAPVLLVHGELDGVVPASRSRDAERALITAGVPVQSQYTPNLAHDIDEAGVAIGAAFLRKAFE